MFKPFLLALALGLGTVCAAQTPATVRLRGSIEKMDGASMIFRERGGETMTLAVPPTVTVAEVVPIDIGAIQPGSFIGSAAVPGPDGTLQALEVHVFPEAQRGTGEGHRPFDLQPQSTMTNATVAELSASPTGRTLKLKYKDGEKTLVVPADVPIVTYRPADTSLLVPGARVIVTVEKRGDVLTLVRVQAGRNGFVPPM
jgi:hypothetical protein